MENQVESSRKEAMPVDTIHCQEMRNSYNSSCSSSRANQKGLNQVNS